MTRKEKLIRYNERRERGLCVRCGEPSEGFCFCIEHREERQEAKHIKIIEKNKLGLCRDCTEPAIKDSIYCAKHKKYVVTYVKNRRRRQRKKGLCYLCNKVTRKGKTLCAKCANKGVERQAKRKAAGLCAHCPNKAMNGKTQCRDCVWKSYPRYTRHTAKQRNLPVTVSDEVLRQIAKQPCHYCGGTDLRGFNGIDCKVYNEGYVEGNMLPCCWVHNWWKGRMSYETFIAMILVSAKHLSTKVLDKSTIDNL